MSTISTALRNFKEPTKEQLTQNFFSLSGAVFSDASAEKSQEIEKMDINAVLSLGVEGVEDSYVRECAIVTVKWRNLLMLMGPYMLGWQIVSDATVSDLHLARPQIRQIHLTIMHHPPSRAAECPRGDICTQSLLMARNEDS